MKIFRIVDNLRLLKWKKEGLKIGRNTSIQRDVHIDGSFPWLVEIGNNVTLAPEVLILTHDGSTKKILDYSKVGMVTIDDNVFVGAKTTILPNTHIGENTIVGANSVVSGKFPKDVVIAGNPAKIIMSLNEFKEKHKTKFNVAKKYDVKYTKKGKINIERKKEMIEELKKNSGYII